MSFSVGLVVPSILPIAPATAQSQQLPSPHVYCGTPMSFMSSASHPLPHPNVSRALPDLLFFVYDIRLGSPLSPRSVPYVATSVWTP
eukprot:3821710-Pleurochrysis_carterae.AAC.7